ncbi:hypothetical protein [Nocardia vaccinii]|nr:hypothetical protein [Nocardia vaccinii]
MRLSNPAALFDKQQTGIPEIDMWVAGVNPHHRSAPSAVSSPDYRSAF